MSSIAGFAQKEVSQATENALLQEVNQPSSVSNNIFFEENLANLIGECRARQ